MQFTRIQKMRARLLTASILTGFSTSVYAEDSNAHALAYDLTYAVEVYSNVKGGLKRDSALLGQIDMGAELDGAAIGLSGLTFGTRAHVNHGPSASESFIGDAQGATNLEADSGFWLVEAWADFAVADSLRVRAGILDLNSEFEVHEWDSIFINASHEVGYDFSQSGAFGPSLTPLTTLGGMVLIDIAPVNFRIGVFDNPALDETEDPGRFLRKPGTGDLLTIAEADISVRENMRLQAGAWLYTKPIDRLLDEGLEETDAARGAYVMIESQFAEFHDNKSLDGWLRVGLANDQVYEADTTLSGALQYGDENARLGVAFAHARLGAPARDLACDAAACLETGETSVEVSYARRISEHLTVRPNVQYIVNPGWDPSLSNALLLGLRLEASIAHE